MPKPLYQQVIFDLEKQIRKMKPNARLPSERQLLVKYGVSRNTIRLALQELEERGLIYRLHGKGTFVSSVFLNQPNIGGMYSFSEEVTRAGQKATTQNRSLELVVPSQHIMEQLNMAANERAYKLVRLRLANNEPRIYSTTYLPEKLFPDLKMADLQEETLYGVLKRKYNQISVMAFEDVQAVSLNKEESSYLDEKMGSSSLKIFRKTINDKNVPVEFTISLARGDKFIYRSRQYNKLL
ncbi:GntR family transcriptional regulator [Lactobacillus xylocopicola]|uniref:GntR family transcriptional regulator n=1 Tax=Lactobacillus xylocopicola TaxID=2976676 RepID=A0ABM8BFL3_9LACO|nr:GntR family transcriptional regulator [Lactobacillus xylocopicola]BDR60046.1 GntR family transcriptional regulator [Lactobacillus xylocopicola]